MISIKTQIISKTQNSKRYDLEERTFIFAKNVRLFVKTLPKTTANLEDGKQLVRSSGSMGANYIEANESLSKKDFVMRVKICRKEAKESAYWIKLIIETKTFINKNEAEIFLNEAIELKRYFQQ